MKYRVVVTPEAQAGIRESFRYIHDRAPISAERWIKGLYDQIDTLERFPERCALASSFYISSKLVARCFCGAGTLACSAETHLGVDAFPPAAKAQFLSRAVVSSNARQRCGNILA